MEMRKLGRAGLEVSALGYGCMGLSAAYGAPPPHAEAIAIMRAAFDGGVTLFDTAEAYGPFSNESLLGEAVERAKRFIHEAIRSNPGLGRGCGPVNHHAEVR